MRLYTSPHILNNTNIIVPSLVLGKPIDFFSKRDSSAVKPFIAPKGNNKEQVRKVIKNSTLYSVWTSLIPYSSASQTQV